MCRLRGHRLRRRRPRGSAAGDALAAPTAWLFGNEARGLPEATVDAADRAVRVPIYGPAESLNVAAAAAICLYASARARSRRRDPGWRPRRRGLAPSETLNSCVIGSPNLVVSSPKGRLPRHELHQVPAFDESGYVVLDSYDSRRIRRSGSTSSTSTGSPRATPASRRWPARTATWSATGSGTTRPPRPTRTASGYRRTSTRHRV